MGEYADELNKQMWSNAAMFDEFGHELCMKHGYPIREGRYSCFLCRQENRNKNKKKEKNK